MSKWKREAARWAQEALNARSAANGWKWSSDLYRAEVERLRTEAFLRTVSR